MSKSNYFPPTSPTEEHPGAWYAEYIADFMRRTAPKVYFSPFFPLSASTVPLFIRPQHDW